MSKQKPVTHVPLLTSSDVLPGLSSVDNFDPKRVRVTTADQVIVKSIRFVSKPASPKDVLVFVAEVNADCSLFFIEHYGWNHHLVYQEICRQLLYANRDFSVHQENMPGRGALGAIHIEKDMPRRSRARTPPFIRYRILQEERPSSSENEVGSSLKKPHSVFVDSLGREFRYQHVMEYIHVDPNSEEASEVFAPSPIRMDCDRTVVMSFDCRWLESEIYDAYRFRARRSTLKNLKFDAVLPPFQTVSPASSYIPDIAMSNQVFVYRREDSSVGADDFDRRHKPSLHNPHPLARVPPISDPPNLQVISPRLNAAVDVYIQSSIDLAKTKLVFSEHTSSPIAWAMFEASLVEALRAMNLSYWSSSPDLEYLSTDWTFDSLRMSLGMHCELDIPWAHRITLYDDDGGLPDSTNGSIRGFRGTWELTHPGCLPYTRCTFRLRRVASEQPSKL